MIPHSRTQISDTDKRAVNATLDSQKIAFGSLTMEFEDQLARYCQANVVKTTCSGTQAIELALRKLQIKQGDQVMMPTYVCGQVADAVLRAGAIPVFVDASDHWSSTAEQFKKSITPDIRAIIAVHIFGIPVDVQKIKELGFPVIEDACQAFGLVIGEQLAGTIGDLGVFSFGATKCLTTAEGGALVSNNPLYTNTTWNSPEGAGLSDLQSALGLSQLQRYGSLLEARIQLKRKYDHAFKSLPEVFRPLLKTDFLFRYPLRIPAGSFEHFASQFAKRGVTVRKGVDELCHRSFALPDSDFPTAMALFDSTLSIPFYPSLTPDEVNRVIEVTLDIYRSIA